MARLLGDNATVKILPADDTGPTWVHTTVSAKAVRAYRRIERRFAHLAIEH